MAPKSVPQRRRNVRVRHRNPQPRAATPRVLWPPPYPGAYWLDAREARAVQDVIRRKTLFRYYGLARPKYVSALERKARRYYGVPHALAINSGTGALMTAMTALGIGPGCEVILPGFLWVATIGAAICANAIPVLAEVDDSFTLDVRDLERRITPQTRLIVAVHMAGAVCDLDGILAVARRHGIPVLEDCAQANGGTYHGRRVGTFGDLGMFSLQWNKNATAGEGGLLITHDAALYERCVAAHDVGLPWVNDAPCRTRPESVTWGGGRRMSELAGAVGSIQLGKLPRIVARMRASKRRIKAQLSGVPGLTFRRLHDPPGDTGAFLIVLLPGVDQAKRAVETMQRSGLRSACRLADYGMHIYSNIPQLVELVPLSPAGNPWSLAENAALVRDYRPGALPQSDALFERSILIPIPSCLTRSQENAAAAIIRRSV